ncbi:hypothetical protein BH10PSE7_BH10PSE7_02690 [soil metagenome]
MRVLAVAALLLPLSTPCSAAEKGAFGKGPPDILAQLERLKRAYPGTITSYDEKTLRLANGTTLPVSDGRTGKTFDELLDNPDIDDMFEQTYPKGAAVSPPPVDFDPGRMRVEELFEALYGNCRSGAVTKAMRKVAWLPKHKGGAVRFTTAQGADKALEAVSRDLDELPDNLIAYLIPTAGTYNCREIAGTHRMSMHAYGAAIDINTKYSAYWRWSKTGEDGQYVWSNKIPLEIVDVFERHGFIWGGRWYHFDTMHFEYRPELLVN